MPRANQPLLTLWRQTRARPRLLGSTLVGLAAAVALPHGLSGPTRALVAWDAGTGLYLVLAWKLMLESGVDRVRREARRQDDGAAVVLAFTVAAAVASLAAIVLELVGVKSLAATQQTQHLVLAGVTIFFSWGFVHTAFALHYAHEFYMEGHEDGPPCLQFPGSAQPDYVDFLYFSFVIGTTSQTADVAIAAHDMRRLALLHGVVAFVFNTTLLALAVNIAAGLI